MLFVCTTHCLNPTNSMYTRPTRDIPVLDVSHHSSICCNMAIVSYLLGHPRLTDASTSEFYARKCPWSLVFTITANLTPKNRFLWQIKPPKWFPPSWHWCSLPRDIHFERKLEQVNAYFTHSQIVHPLPASLPSHTVNLYDKFSPITKHYFTTQCVFVDLHNSSYFTIFDLLI